MTCHLIDFTTAEITETREAADRKAARAVARAMLAPHADSGNVSGFSPAELPKELQARFAAARIIGIRVPSSVPGEQAGYQKRGHGTHFVAITR